LKASTELMLTIRPSRDREAGVPVLVRDLQDGLARIDAGAVDHAVDLAEGLGRLAEQCLRAVPRRDVAFDAERRRIARLDAFHGPRQGRGVPVDERDPRSPRGHHLGGGEAETAGAANDDRRFSLHPRCPPNTPVPGRTGQSGMEVST
jgi:hypothetical protein